MTLPKPTFGHVVTCEHGHEVCEFVRNVDEHDRASVSALGHFREGQREPADGDEVNAAVCGICGSHWARSSFYGSIAVHIKDFGWTDPENEAAA